MRRGEIFWGILLVVLGSLFFLRTAGYLTGDVFNWFWPLFVMAAGAWIILGGFRAGRGVTTSGSFVVPLQGAREASLTINHGAGRLELQAGASTDEFLTGLAAAAMNHTARLNGEKLEVIIDAGPSIFPFIGPEGGVWRYRINPDVPMTLAVHAGASQLQMDLTDVQVTRFSYDGGASSLDLALPAHVAHVSVEIQSGAASLRVRVPQDIAARMQIKSIGSFTIDQDRFAPRGGGMYESANFDAAERRADITIDGGATSIHIS